MASSHDLTGVEALFQQLLREIEETVNESLRLRPARGGKGFRSVPFRRCTPSEKRDVLGLGVNWDCYFDRGLSCYQANRIIDNVVAGKKRDEWLEGVVTVFAGGTGSVNERPGWDPAAGGFKAQG